MNSCAIRSIAGAGIGYVMGFVFPVVMFAFGGGMGVGDTTVGVSARTHWKSYRSEFARSMRGISKSAGGWAMIGFLFGGMALLARSLSPLYGWWPGLLSLATEASNYVEGGEKVWFVKVGRGGEHWDMSVVFVNTRSEPL